MAAREHISLRQAGPMQLLPGGGRAPTSNVTGVIRMDERARLPRHPDCRVRHRPPRRRHRYIMLRGTLLRAEGRRSVLRAAIGRDLKGKVSPLLYCLGIGPSFVHERLGLAVYVGVALMWFVPDRRVERSLTADHETVREPPLEP
jgi:hypothetical protein